VKSFTPFFSKSKYLSGLQCHKLLWYQYNAKDQIPQVDAQSQAIFASVTASIHFNNAEILSTAPYNSFAVRWL
jgi:hypothetical protein